MGAPHLFKATTLDRFVKTAAKAMGVSRDRVRVEYEIGRGVISVFAAEVDKDAKSSNPFDIEAARLRRGQAT
jgi:hypothetical protein